VTANSREKTKPLIVITTALAIVVAVALIIFFYKVSTEPGYWTLNISQNGLGLGSVTPNGTVQVPMRQPGVNVTATLYGWDGFNGWLFDGKQENGTLNSYSQPTVFIPRQQGGSNHTLEAQFVVGTPPIYPIGPAQVIVNAGEYQAYNFTVPSGTGKILDVFNSTGIIQVYVMNSANFTYWQNGLAANAVYSSGQVTNGYIDNVVLPSSGTYYLIYDNTKGLNSCTIDSQASYFYVPP
jgi:hypothetical protein